MPTRFVAESTFIVAPIVCWGLCFGPSLVMYYFRVHSGFANISLTKEDWLFYFSCLLGTMWLLVFCVSYLQCHIFCSA